MEYERGNEEVEVDYEFPIQESNEEAKMKNVNLSFIP
jgi:hypothetical protein